MNPYQILRINPGATEDEIKKAYRSRMMQCHPDRGGSEEEAKLVNRAFEMLMKPQPEPMREFRPTVVVYYYSTFSWSANTASSGGYWV